VNDFSQDIIEENESAGGGFLKFFYLCIVLPGKNNLTYLVRYGRLPLDNSIAAFT
jgi:hypothetical protein